MPFQHIFTSAQIGLHPGSSGYCTVAQTEGIPGDLVKALEKLSTYDFSTKNDAEMEGHSPVIFSYQFVRVHSGTFFVVSRINDAGADHTGRTNYLAQHLALDSSEVEKLQDFPHLNPAFFLLAGKKWKDAWDQMPEVLPRLDFESLVPGSNKESIYVRDYKRDGGLYKWKNNLLHARVESAPTLLEHPYNTKCFLYLNPGWEQDLLELLAETLWLSGKEAWHHTFTTFLQQGESHENYAWCGVSGGNAQQQAAAAGQNLLPLQNLPPSTNEALVTKAQTGQEQVAEAPAPPTVPAPGETTETQAPITQLSAPSQAAPTTQASEAPADIVHPEVTSPPSVEDFETTLNQIGPPEKDAKRKQCISDFKFQNKCYAKYISSYIESHLDAFEGEERIEAKEHEVGLQSAELVAKARERKGSSTSNVLMAVRTEIYDTLSDDIKAIKNRGDQPDEAPDTAPDEAPGPVRSPFKIGPEIISRHLKNAIAAFIVMALAALAFIFREKIKTTYDNWQLERAALTNLDDNRADDNRTDGNTNTTNDTKKPDTKKPDTKKPDTKPDNPKLKEKVDKYFGTTYVSLFVKVDIGSKLTGNEAPLLFRSLELVPKGDPGSIKVYQPEKDPGFKDLAWVEIDSQGDIFSDQGLDLLYPRTDGFKKPGIRIKKFPKWDTGDDKLKDGTPSQIKLYKNKRNDFRAKEFVLEVKQNSAIHTTIGGQNEILYILNKAGTFFPGLFDEAVNKPGSNKLEIEPYLMGPLVNRVRYKGATAGFLVMVVPASVIKDRNKDKNQENNLPQYVTLKQKKPGDQEWVVDNDDLDAGKRSAESYHVQPVKHITWNGEEPEEGVFQYPMGSLLKFKLQQGAKIKFILKKGVEVTWLKASNNNILKSIGGNEFEVKREINAKAPFFCRLKPTEGRKVQHREQITFSVKFSEVQRNEWINPLKAAKRKRDEAFKATLKVNSVLGYYKGSSVQSGVPVLIFNRKK